MKKNCFLLILTILFVFFSCQKSPNEPELLDNQVPENKIALVCVIENNNTVGGETLESVFQLFKSSVLPVFSDFFKVDKDSMKNMTLTQIVDVYGEAWQISEIKSIANEHYDKFISLTDLNATSEILIDSLSMLSANEYVIDMIYNLHGNSYGIAFQNDFVYIKEFVAFLEEKNIKIRALYQTCCQGYGMVDEWNEYGIKAVNGTEKNNSFALFSPIFFLREWVSGVPYSQAVQNAYNLEITEIKGYSDRLPVDNFFLTDEIKSDSRQKVGGTQPDLLWETY